MVNPHSCYIMFLFEIVSKNENSGFGEIYLTWFVQFLVYGLTAMYLEQISSSGSDDQGKSLLFFLQRKSSIDKNIPLSFLEMNIEENQNCLKIRNLSKKFGSFVAIENVNIDLEFDKIYCLLGQNGAGKSTLINLLTGIYTPTSGKIYYKQRDFVQLLKEENPLFKIGVCGAEDVLFDDMTVFQHFKMMTIIRNSNSCESVINTTLESIGLGVYSDYKISQLSRGNKRKVSIGLALIGNPQIILLDEPTSSLDSISRKDIWEMILQLKRNNQERVILMTTHHLQEAERIADGIIFLADGRVKTPGKIEDLKKIFGIGCFIEIVSKETLDVDFFDRLVVEIDKGLFQYKLDKENIKIMNNKIEIKVSRGDIGHIRQLFAAIRAHVPAIFEINLSTNTFEKSYFGIEKQIRKNPEIFPNEKIETIMKKLYKNSSFSKVNFFSGIFLVAKNKLNFLIHEKHELIKITVQYCITYFILAFFIIYFPNQKIEINLFSLSALFHSFLNIEIIVSPFSVYNLVYENERNIRHLMTINKISPVMYFVGKILADVFLQIIIYGVVFSISLFIMFFNYPDQELATVFIRMSIKIFCWKIAFCFGGMLLFRLFKSPKLIFVLYPLFYYLVFMFVHSLVFIFNNSLDFRLLNDFTHISYILSDQEYTLLATVKYYSVISMFYLLLTIIIEEFSLRINYFNKFESFFLNNEANESRLSMDNDHTFGMDRKKDSKSVKTEKNETISDVEKKIKVINITKKYSKGKVVLNNVTFNVQQSCNLGLVGPNGAGKSTLLNIILGKVQKTSGELYIKKNNFLTRWTSILVEPNPYLENNFGVALQVESVWDELSVKDNLYFYASLHSIDFEALEFILRYFEFDCFLNKKVSELSSGNKKKLCILNSFMINPNVILYDEATLGLDLTMRFKLKQFFDFFKKNNKMSSILTTHFLKDIEIFCDEIGIIEKGELIFVDSVENIKSQFKGYVANFSLIDHSTSTNLINILKSMCEVKSNNVENNGKKLRLILTEIKDLFEIFLYFCELEKEKLISEFSLKQLSIEDIYLDMFSSHE